MVQFFRINVGYRARERSLLNTILAIATGILTIIYPNFLYLIVAGYLVLLGILIVYFMMPPLLDAFSVVVVLWFCFVHLIILDSLTTFVCMFWSTLIIML